MSGPLILNADPVDPLGAATKQYADTKVDESLLGQPDGVATLDSSGLVPASQLPSYVDDVLEYANLASFPVTGETGKIYIAIDTGNTYRWSGSTYVQISASGANQELSNLTSPTSVNQDLVPDIDSSKDLGSVLKYWFTAFINQIFVGNLYPGRLGDKTNADSIGSTTFSSEVASQHTTIETIGDNTANSVSTGSLYLLTGNKLAGTGNSGDINIKPGTSAGGQRGKIKLRDGSEGTVGHVWTSTGVNGEGAWAEPTGGNSSLGINYILNGDAEDGTTGWATYNDGASAAPVDGTGGTASSLSLGVDPTELIRKDNHFSFTQGSGSGSAQGQGWSYDFAIAPADANKRLGVSFEYAFFTGLGNDYASGDWACFIYDVDNATLLGRIQNDDNGDIVRNGDAISKFVGFFDATDSLNYRFIIHIVTSATKSSNMRSETYFAGPVGFVPVQFQRTETINAAGSGDFTGGEFLVTRIGNAVTITTPVAITFASNSAPISAAGLLPEWARPQNSVSNVYIDGSSNTSRINLTAAGEIAFAFRNYSGTLTALTSANQTTTISYNVNDASTNIVSNTELTQKTVTVRGAGNNGAAITSNVTNINWTEIEDTHGAWNGSQFTAPKDGWYEANGAIRLVSAVGTGSVGSFINGVLEKTCAFTAVNTFYFQFNWKGKLNKGDVLSFRYDINATLSNNPITHWIQIQSLPDFTTYGVLNPNTELKESAIALTNYIIAASTWGDLTSITLEAGEWDLSGFVNMFSNGAVVGGNFQIGVSTTPGNSGAGLIIGDNSAVDFINGTSGAWVSAYCPEFTVSPTATTTYYLKCNKAGSITNLQHASKLRARRVK